MKKQKASLTPEQKARRRKCALRFWCVFLSAVIIVGAVITTAFAVWGREPEIYGKFAAWTPQAAFDINDYPTLEVEAGREIKIMQMTDLHLTFGFDSRTKKLVKAALASDKPDIVVLTGDVTMTPLTYFAFKAFARFMEQQKQYWTFVFGNHEVESGVSKYTLYKLLEPYKYCLFDCGPSAITGANHIVNIKQAGEYTYSLILLDSNMYPESAGDRSLFDFVYDWVHEDQVEWFNWAIAGLKKQNAEIRASVFFHMPTIEYAKMHYAANPDLALEHGVDISSFAPVSNVTGRICEEDKPDEYIVDENYRVGIFYGGENVQAGRTPGQNSSIFTAMKASGIVDGAFCGHDHVNTLRGYYDGIYLCYGRNTGAMAYPFFTKDNFLLRLFGWSENIMFNGGLWTDADGKAEERGVTNIFVNPKAKTITVIDRPQSSLNK